MLEEQAPADSAAVRRGRPLTRRQHVTLWVVGVVLASLLPLLVLYLHGLTGGRPPGFVQLLGHGDLLLIGVVVTIAGLMELVRSWDKVKDSQIFIVAIAVLGAVLIVASEALWYALISESASDVSPIRSATANTYGSLALFAFSIVCGAVCVWVAAGGD